MKNEAVREMEDKGGVTDDEGKKKKRMEGWKGTGTKWKEREGKGEETGR